SHINPIKIAHEIFADRTPVILRTAQVIQIFQVRVLLLFLLCTENFLKQKICDFSSCILQHTNQDENILIGFDLNKGSFKRSNPKTFFYGCVKVFEIKILCTLVGIEFPYS